MDINTCADTCTHAKEGVGLEVGSLQQTPIATQYHLCLHVTMQKGWSIQEKPDGHAYIY